MRTLRGLLADSRTWFGAGTILVALLFDFEPTPPPLGLQVLNYVLLGVMVISTIVVLFGLRRYLRGDASLILLMLCLLVAVTSLCSWSAGAADGAGCSRTRETVGVAVCAFSQHMAKPDSIYFTIVTISTTGFGDIQPLSTPARMLVAGEISLAFTIVVFGVARFFSLRTKV